MAQIVEARTGASRNRYLTSRAGSVSMDTINLDTLVRQGIGIVGRVAISWYPRACQQSGRVRQHHACCGGVDGGGRND